MDRFRREVWTRDGAKDRATGQALYQSHAYIEFRGQCCHLQSKGAYPERRTDPTNAVLMSELNHILSDHRGGRLLRLTDPQTGEPATDASKPIQFTLFTTKGTIVWSRIS